jgi:hypothetical protein
MTEYFYALSYLQRTLNNIFSPSNAGLVSYHKTQLGAETKMAALVAQKIPNREYKITPIPVED